MTTNPWERLRKAALRLTRSVNKLVHPLHDNALRRDAMESVDAVQAALAALPPAQTDAEREQAIEAWRKEIIAYVRALLRDEQIPGRGGDKLIDEAVALMRSAPQKPAAEEPKPASPASDWRERFEASRNSTAETLCLRDGLIAAEDRIAAVEDRLAKIERGAP